MEQYLLRHTGITCDQQVQILEINIFNKFYYSLKMESKILLYLQQQNRKL